MAAFEASADPKSALDRGYYVEEPRGSISSRMLGRLALRPSSSHILVGGIGSGKTTQLLRLEKDLNNISDTFSKYIDVSEHGNITKLSSGSFVAIAGLVIADFLDGLPYDKGVESTRHIRSIKASVSGSSEWVPHASNTNQDFKFSEVFSQQEKFNYLDTHFLNSIKLLLPIINSPVILLDGLDRLANSKIFMNLLISDLPILKALGIGVVVIAPLSTFYRQEDRETIKQVSQYSDYYQFCYDAEYDPEAKRFLAEIITTRSSSDFIDDRVIEKLVKYSGGVIRDLINLTQSSIEEAYISGDDRISEEHVQSALLSFSGAQFLGLSNREMGILERVMNDKEFYPKTEEELKLLLSRRILEYTHPKRRFVVHPAIEMGLKEKVA
jgi:hypothetical protein